MNAATWYIHQRAWMRALESDHWLTARQALRVMSPSCQYERVAQKQVLHEKRALSSGPGSRPCYRPDRRGQAAEASCTSFGVNTRSMT